MHRVRVAGLVATMVAAIFVPIVSADTADGPNGDRRVAGGQFTFVGEDGQTYAASADVVDDRLTGTVLISASYFSSTVVICPGEDLLDPSDDYEGSIETSFFAVAPAATSSFGSKLATASATGTVTGDITRYDPCTGETTVIGQDTVAVAIDLVASGGTSSSLSHSFGTDEQGNRTVTTFRTSERPAAGTISFDGDAHSVDAVILSQVWRTVPR